MQQRGDFCLSKRGEGDGSEVYEGCIMEQATEEEENACLKRQASKQARYLWRMMILYEPGAKEDPTGL